MIAVPPRLFSVRLTQKVQPLLLGLFWFGSTALLTAAEPGPRPNILWILTDDHRADSLACFNRVIRGGPESALGYVSSLHIDALAEEGVLFTHATFHSPACVPSRSSMQTGRCPSLHKWWHNGDYGRVPDGNEEGRIWPLYENSPLPIGHVAQRAERERMLSILPVLDNCNTEHDLPVE